MYKYVCVCVFFNPSLYTDQMFLRSGYTARVTFALLSFGQGIITKSQWTMCGHDLYYLYIRRLRVHVFSGQILFYSLIYCLEKVFYCSAFHTVFPYFSIYTGNTTLRYALKYINVCSEMYKQKLNQSNNNNLRVYYTNAQSFPILYYGANPGFTQKRFSNYLKLLANRE